jgi:hypothetical protein
VEPLTEAVVVALVPGIVEIAKRVGLSTRYAGLAAIVAATAVIALSDLATSASNAGEAASWLVRGVIAGLASAGLYSQATRIGRRASS